MIHTLCTSYLKPKRYSLYSIGYTYCSIRETMNLSVKDPLKKYIKRLETHVHNRLERKGLTDFRSGITLESGPYQSCISGWSGLPEDFNLRIKKGLTGVRQSPIINQFYTDQYTPEYSLKKAFDFLDRKEFNYYMWWFQFIDKEDANLRIGSFRKSFDLRLA